MTIDVTCDSSLNDTEVGLLASSVTQNTCHPVIGMRSRHGCPSRHLSSLWKILYDNRVVFCVLMIIVGLIILVFGSAFRDAILFVAATISAFILFVFIAYNFVIFQTLDWRVDLGIFAGILLAAVLLATVSYFCTNQRLSQAIIGLFIGLLLGEVLYSTVLIELFQATDLIYFIIMELVFGITLMIIAILFLHKFVMLSTSILGSYLFVRGISLVAGGFTNESLLYNEVRYGNYRPLPWSNYIYLFSLIVVTYFGCMLQHFETLAPCIDRKSQACRGCDERMRKAKESCCCNGKGCKNCWQNWGCCCCLQNVDPERKSQ